MPMFGDINMVILMGNVTNDPDLRYTPSGAAVLNFGFATNRRYKKGEEWVDEPTFHNIVVWRSAESLAKRIRKGTRLHIVGRTHTRSWEGDDGKKRYRTEITAEDVTLIARYEGSNDEGYNTGSAPAKKTENSNSSKKSDNSNNSEESIDPDDLPF